MEQNESPIGSNIKIKEEFVRHIWDTICRSELLMGRTPNTITFALDYVAALNNPGDAVLVKLLIDRLDDSHRVTECTYYGWYYDQTEQPVQFDAEIQNEIGEIRESRPRIWSRFDELFNKN